MLKNVIKTNSEILLEFNFSSVCPFTAGVVRGREGVQNGYVVLDSKHGFFQIWNGDSARFWTIPNANVLTIRYPGF